MFSKINFIVPLNLDVTLKIRNINGRIVHILKEATCTLKQVENLIHIKQSSESSLISLNFSTVQEARDAHILLRDALTQLQINQSSTSNNFFTHIISPIFDTVINTDTDFLLNFPISTILDVHVNGVLVNDNNYVLLSSPTRFRWLGSAIYILETTDIITIHYY